MLLYKLSRIFMFTSRETKKLIDILAPYCDKIRYDSRHYVCYPKGVDRIIVVSNTSSDRNRDRQVYREFRRFGIIIQELKRI